MKPVFVTGHSFGGSFVAKGPLFSSATDGCVALSFEMEEILARSILMIMI